MGLIYWHLNDQHKFSKKALWGQMFQFQVCEKDPTSVPETLQILIHWELIKPRSCLCVNWDVTAQRKRVHLLLVWSSHLV